MMYCDWCGKEVSSYWTGEDGTISCRPCLDNGYNNRNKTKPSKKSVLGTEEEQLDMFGGEG